MTRGRSARAICGLTLQSRGHAPASRVMPLISNVERQVVDREFFALRSRLQGQKLGPPLVRERSELHRLGPGRLPCFACGCSSFTRLTRSPLCPFVAWCGYQEHGQPLVCLAIISFTREARWRSCNAAARLCTLEQRFACKQCRRPTHQSTGHAPASWVMLVISTLGRSKKRPATSTVEATRGEPTDVRPGEEDRNAH